MRAWWEARSARERPLLVAGALVLGIGLGYGLLWAPLQRAVALRQARVDALRADLAWMRGAAVQLAALRTWGAPSAPAQAAARDIPLARAVAASARGAGLGTVLELPAAAGTDAAALRIGLKPVPFATLMPWLAGLRAQGIETTALMLDAAGGGRVRGSLELRRAAAPRTSPRSQ